MNDEVPPLQAGRIRLAILLDRGTLPTPGAIAQAAGDAVEHLGNVVVLKDHALVDVAEEAAELLLERLGAAWPVQVHSRPTAAAVSWSWLRLAIGRNHSLSPATLKRILAKAGCRQVGTYQIRNTCAFVGVPADAMNGIIKALAEVRVNGYALRPRAAEREDRPRQDPRFQGKP